MVCSWQPVAKHVCVGAKHVCVGAKRVDERLKRDSRGRPKHALDRLKQPTGQVHGQEVVGVRFLAREELCPATRAT